MKWKEYRKAVLTTIDTEAYYTEYFKDTVPVHRNGQEMKCRCPFPARHLSGGDTDPSFTVNVATGVYFCNSCGAKGNVHTFICETQGVDKATGWYILGDALGLERPADQDTRPLIDPALPGKYHRALMSNDGVIRDILSKKRGLTNETLKRYMIGWDGERVTIPVYDEYGELANIRRYAWNAYEGRAKMVNYVDPLGNTFGEARIYGVENLTDPSVESIIWCEGEWDRLVAEQHGYAACTSTAGANSFRNEWIQLLANKKRIYVCYDNDEPGRRASDAFIDKLRGKAELYVVQWPKDWREKGDITDILVADNWRMTEFMKLFQPLTAAEEVIDVGLAASSQARYAGKRLRVPVLVAGKEATPYIYPQEIVVTCEHADEDKKMCQACKLCYQKRVDISVTSSTPMLLKLIDCSDDQQFATLRRIAGASVKCSAMDIDVKAYGNLEGIQMVPKADTGINTASRAEYVSRTGYMIGNGLPANKKYSMIGYMHADPTSQRATYIFDQAIPDKDMTDDLEVTSLVLEQLKVFQPAPGQSIADKFDEIHKDLERNVTYIWDRRKVGIAVDLVYHTALSFTFQEQTVKRGWAECLIIGDSGQAKTTLVERLMTHYRAGELLSGESSRRTGLVYNLQQNTSRGGWTLMWGAMPLNDGGLLTVDELSGMSEEDLAKMSDVRSSGIAKATGVVTGETTARTRMIFISNPRNGRQLKSENYGVSTILKLWGKAEDVRRLDFALAVASGEVDTSVVNKAVSEMPLVQHVYTSDRCKMLIMWAWSRRPEHIEFMPEATRRILECAEKMGTKYSSRIPLVEPADQRLKLARLSVSTAIRMFSADDSGERVIVRPEHVDFVYNYLQSIYDTRAMAYDRFSTDEFENSDATVESLNRLRTEYISLPFVSHTIIEVTKALYQMPYFNRNTLEDATGLDRDELRSLLQYLIANSLIEKAGMDYKRTPLGLSFIESILVQPPTQLEIKEARAARYAQSSV